jgi:uncharacterized protein YdaU (DUF1376 family)
MRKYKFRIHEYLIETRGIPDAEDLAYRRLMDLCYLSEAPIPGSIGHIAAVVNLDYDCVEPVLKRFFKQTPQGWITSVIEEDLAAHAKRVEHSRKIGKIGGTNKGLRNGKKES